MRINDKIDISIKSYIGQLEDGVLALLSIMYDSKSYEGTYWYDKEYRVLTADDELTEILGDIEKIDEYEDIMKYLYDNISDFDEIYKTLSPL